MSQAFKILLKTIHNHIYQNEANLSIDQFGFSDGLGTRDTSNASTEMSRPEKKYLYMLHWPKKKDSLKRSITLNYYKYLEI